MLRGLYMFLHVANASVTDAEIASTYSKFGMVVAHTGMSNHRKLNLVTWKILLQHFLLFWLVNVGFRIQFNFAIRHYLHSLFLL